MCNCEHCKKINDMHRNKYYNMHPDELASIHEEILDVQEEQLEALECIENILCDMYPEHEWHRRGRRRSYHREGYNRGGSYRRDGEYGHESDYDMHRQGVKGTGRYGIGGSRHYSHRRY